jgi:hypothetical protein
MATKERLAEIAKLLFENTVAGKIPWEKSSTKDEFQAPFGAKYIVVIKGSSDYPYLTILDQDGDTVEDLSFTAAREADVQVELRQLYQGARRKALGSDEAVDEILRELRLRQKA